MTTSTTTASTRARFTDLDLLGALGRGIGPMLAPAVAEELRARWARAAATFDRVVTDGTPAGERELRERRAQIVTARSLALRILAPRASWTSPDLDARRKIAEHLTGPAAWLAPLVLHFAADELLAASGDGSLMLVAVARGLVAIEEQLR